MKTGLIAALLLFSFFCSAQENTPSCNCCQETYRQFDFWVGNWEVKDSAGTLLGHNRIELIEDSCGLRENWTGAKGTTGTSISFYNSTNKQWHQSWIDGYGGSIIMNGSFTDGAMVMLSPKKENESGYVQNKTTWRPLSDGRVKHTWEITKDGGQSWSIVFEGYYSTVKP